MSTLTASKLHQLAYSVRAAVAQLSGAENTRWAVFAGLLLCFSVQATPVQSPTSDTVKGRAPQAGGVLVNNQSAPGKVPSPDSVLQGIYLYTDEDGDLELDTQLQWRRAGVNIPGATSAAYTVQSADDNQELTFQVTPVSSTTADPDTGLAAISPPVQVTSFAPEASSLNVQGLNLVGETFTAAYDYADRNGDAEGVSTFKWFRGATEVAGSTARTYNLTSADQGAAISFEVTPVSSTGGARVGTPVRSAGSPVIGTVQGTAPVIRSATLVGSAVVGGGMTVDYDYFDADNDLEGTSTFQWRTNESGAWANIPGATQDFYVLAPSQEGFEVAVAITPVARTGVPGAGAVFQTQASSTVVAGTGAAPVAGSPRIDGDHRVGEVLTANYQYSDADVDPEGATTFKWVRFNYATYAWEDISGANRQTYTIPVADVGFRHSVHITPVALSGTPNIGNRVNPETGYGSAAKPPRGSAPVAQNVRYDDYYTPGTPATVGRALTAKYDFSDADGDAQSVSTYQWLRDNVPLGVVSREYTPVHADANHQLTVQITPRTDPATSDPSVGLAVTSPATSAVIGVRPPEAKSAAITGNNQVGQVLTAYYEYFDADNDLEGPTTFNWLKYNGSSWIEIPGATSQTYILQKSDEGLRHTVHITPIALTGSPNTGVKANPSTSSGAAAKPGSAPAASGMTLNGILRVGETLNMAYNYLDADGDLEGGSTFQWKKRLNGTGSWIIIPGANSKTYTLTPADQGHAMTVIVTPVALTGEPKVGLSDTYGTGQSGIVVAKSGSAPTITATGLQGTMQVGQTITVNYTFVDVDNDLEGGTIINWCYWGSPCASLGTGRTYTIKPGDVGRTMEAHVTPVASTGTPTVGSLYYISRHPEIVWQNTAPTVTNLRITGIPKTGSTLTMDYNYQDADGDAEGASYYNWCWAGWSCGKGSGKTKVVSGADVGYRFDGFMAPVSATGVPDRGVEQPVPGTATIVHSVPPEYITPNAGRQYVNTAPGICSGLGARVPTEAELQSLFNSSTTGGNNTQMCDYHSWPLNGKCGGSATSNYWVQGSNRVFNMQGGYGGNPAGGESHFVVCRR
jgi:hypothetical protein